MKELFNFEFKGLTLACFWLRAFRTGETNDTETDITFLAFNYFSNKSFRTFTIYLLNMSFMIEWKV